jgi:hypothetical protein
VVDTARASAIQRAGERHDPRTSVAAFRASS